MPRSKAVWFDFYSVMMPSDAAKTFEEVLEDVGATDDDDARNRETSTGVYRLNEFGRNARQATIEGQVIRIRMDDLPVKASLAGEISHLNLKDDEGIGEQTAFIYDPKTETLLLQRNRAGVTANAFLQYFTSVADLDESIVLHPVLGNDALERLASLRTVSKLEIAVAAPRSTEFLSSNVLSVSRIQDLVEYFQAPVISIAVSKGHSRAAPIKEKVVKTVRAMLRVSGEDSGGRVTKLQVSGKAEEGEPEAINFLVDQLRHRAHFTTDGQTRAISFEARIREMRKAMARKLNP